MTDEARAGEPRRFPVRIKVYGGGLSLLPPGTTWRVERVTEHVQPSGSIGEPLPEWTILDLIPEPRLSESAPPVAPLGEE